MENFRDQYKEESEYNDRNLKIAIEKLEEGLDNINNENEISNKAQLIRKLHILEELVQKYKALDMISSNEENYEQVIAEYEYHKEQVEEELGKLQQEDRIQDDKSWEEFKQEEIENDNEEKDSER